MHVAAGAQPFYITVHDFDADGFQDLAVANTGGGGIALLRATGSSGIGPETFAAPSFIGSGNTSQATPADVNQDGITDLLVSLATVPGKIRLYRGQGTGLFNAAEFGDPSPTEYPVGDNAIQAVVADFNSDGRLDVTGPNYYNDYISVLLGACTTDPNLPTLTDVRDVPNDEGGKVFLTWTRSSLDVSGGAVNAYRVWRRIPPGQLATPRPSSERVARPVNAANGTTIEYWEALATLPAQRLPGYGYTAATTQDSILNSNPYTAFFVTALTSNIDVFYSSNVDSGYSVDNTPPPPPEPLVGLTIAPSGVALHWEPSAVPDFLEYRVYRGLSPGFVPSQATFRSAQPDTGYADTDGMGYTYKLTVVDQHGNEGPPAAVTPLTPVSVGPPGASFALHGIRPNPARDGELVVWFTLPDREPAELTVVDLAGRVVASRRVSGAGARSVVVAPERGLAAGVYLVKLTRGTETLRTKAVVMR